MPTQKTNTSASTLELLAEYRANPTLANRNRVVSQNLGLVEKTARRFAQNSREPYADLYAVGCIGLIKAVERFDLSTGHQFSSYAVPRIRGEMLHYQRDHGSPGGLKVPRAWVDRRRRILAGDFSGIPLDEQDLAAKALQFQPLKSLSCAGEDGEVWEIADPRATAEPVVATLPTDDEYFNATAIAQRYGRSVHHWRQTPRAKKIIAVFAKQNRGKSAVISARGRNGLTWIHMDLAADFLRWVHPETSALVCYAYSAAIEAQLR